jgi:hypothetical protein
MIPTFNPSAPTELCSIMEKHGSDKGSHNMREWHNYTTLYSALFSDKRDSIQTVFELGLGTNFTDIPSNMGIHGKPGASHRGWAEYFPNALVYGADIDKRVLFNTDRISTYYCDQLNPATIKEMWEHMPIEFDIMLDDGLHLFASNKCFFDNSFHKLAVGGTYIVEDIVNDEVDAFVQQIPIWETMHPTYTFQLIAVPHHNHHDNRLLVIKRNA